VRARVLQNVAVELGEEWSSAENRGFDFDAIQALDFRIAGEGGERHAAAESDDQHPAQS